MCSSDSTFLYRGKKSVDNCAIVLAMFGTSVENGLPGLLYIQNRMKERFPQTPVHIAFSSSIIRQIWRKRSVDKNYRSAHPEIPDDVFAVLSPEEVVITLHEEGVESLVVQAVQIAPFAEEINPVSYLGELNSAGFQKLAPVTFRQLAFGRPVLGVLGANNTSTEDIVIAAGTLFQDASRAVKQNAALFYMGHGNRVASTSRVYNKLLDELRRQYPNIVIVMNLVEGASSIDGIVEKLKTEHVKNVLLKPFMLVAGDHARKDMVGDGPNALQARLEAEGFEVVPVMDGLGENEAFADIFVQHTIDAAQDAGIELV